MQRLKAVSALVAGFLLAVAPDAQAQTHGQSAASTWNDSWATKNSNERALDLAQAEAQLQARRGGFGPANSTTNYNGPVSSTTTYNGPVSSTSSGATNIGQSNSTSSTINGSGSWLTVSTGQSVGDGISQGASATAQVTKNGTTTSSNSATGK